MLPRAITSDEHTLIQKDGQWVELLACIPVPAAVFTARVNGAPGTTDRVTAITFDGGAGTLADVLPGQTLWVGSAAGTFDRGQARIRKAPISGTFYIGTESELAIADNDYLTVVDEFGLWQKRVRIEAGVIYMDEDVVYAGQHAAPLPVVVMGGPVVLELISDSVIALFDASGSWVPGGGSKTYSWSAPGSASSSGMTTATPTILYSAAGRYRVSCTVTINAVSNTRYEYVQVFDVNNPPVTQFQVRSVSGSKAEGGYSFQMTMFAEAGLTTVRDRAQVILFTRDHYGTAGQVSTGYATGRLNILAAGWIEGETILWSSEVSSVVFSVSGAHAWLGRITAYPQGLEDVTTTPALWTDFNTLTMTAMLWHLFTWRSTVAAAIDCIVENSATRVIELAAAATTLWEQLQVTAGQRLLALPCTDHLSRLFVLIDSQFREDRSGVVEVMTLDPADWRNPVQINRVTVPPVSMVDLNGFAWDGTTATALFALSPGREWKRYGRVQSVQALLLTGQAQANALAGLIAGQANNPYPTIPLQLAANNRFLDIAPDCYALLTLAEADNVRGLTFTARRLIPRRIGWTYDAESGGLLPSIDFEAESFPELAVTGDAPPVEPDPPPDPPPDDSCPPGYHWDADLETCVVDDPTGIGDGNTIYVATRSQVGRTRNFLDASPNWEDITGVIAAQLAADSDQINGFILDPYFPVDRAYVLTYQYLYRTANLNDAAPDWEIINTNAAGTFFLTVAAAITAPGMIYVGGGSESDGGLIFAGATGGAHDPNPLMVTWSGSTVADNLNGDALGKGIRRIVASLKTPGKAWLLQGQSNRSATLYETVDGGANWVVRHTEGAFHRAYDFEVSYSPDPDLADRFIYWFDSSPGDAQILRNQNSGVGPWAPVLNEDVSLPQGNPWGTPMINMATQNFDDVLIVTRAESDNIATLYRTTDGGDTWATAGTYGGGLAGHAYPVALGRWPYDPDIVFLLWDSTATGVISDILFSTDGAANWDSKLGDWATVFGAAFADPVMIVPLWLSTE